MKTTIVWEDIDGLSKLRIMDDIHWITLRAEDPENLDVIVIPKRKMKEVIEALTAHMAKEESDE